MEYGVEIWECGGLLCVRRVWGLGSRPSGGAERDRRSQEPQGSAPSPAGGSGLGGVRQAEPGACTPKWGREHPHTLVQPADPVRGHPASRISRGRLRVGLGPLGSGMPGRRRAIDGKALRIHGRELPGVRLVAAYAGESGLVFQKGGQG